MLRSTLLLVLVFLSLGCASVPMSYKDVIQREQVHNDDYALSEYYPDGHLSLPEALFINLYIDNYEIVDFNVHADKFDNLPDIEFGSRYSDGHILLMSFYPSPSVNGSYWLAKVPPIRSGVQTIRANLYRHSVTLSPGIMPPDEIRLDLSVRNGTVEWAHIENASENTIGLRYERLLMYNGIRFGVITSRMFPYETWRFRFPTTDGRFNIAVKKTVSGCFGSKFSQCSI